MKHSLGLGRILPPARLESETPWSEIRSTNCSAMQSHRYMQGFMAISAWTMQSGLKLGVGCEGGALYIYANSLRLL